jgi:hypothetical protein
MLCEESEGVSILFRLILKFCTTSLGKIEFVAIRSLDVGLNDLTLKMSKTGISIDSDPFTFLPVMRDSMSNYMLSTISFFES